MIDGLRPAVAADLAAVEALVARSYGAYVAQIGQRPGPMDDDYAASIGAGWISVVERDGGLVALLVLIPQGAALLLDNIAVDPSAQSLGLGRALLALTEDVARACGFDCIRLYTHEKMVRNQMIYAQAGFAETRRVTERGLPRVYMEKALT